MNTLTAISGLTADMTIAWTDPQWIEWVSLYELDRLSRGFSNTVPVRSKFATDKDYDLYRQGVLLALQRYNAGERYKGIDREAVPDFGATTAAYKETYIDFRGAQSGLELKSWEGYPAYYPRLQLTAETVNGKDNYRLAFWNWENNEPWLSYYPISYLPKGTQSNTGYWYVPLTSVELGRFLVGYNAALAAGKTGKESVAAGRSNMFFRNEIVYKTGDKVYDPWTGSDMNNLPAGGQWVWKWVDGWNMLWCAVQEYIDKFLKVPYNVRDLVSYGESYENVLKGILIKGSAAEKYTKLQNYFGNVDFLAAPVGTKGFWDKLADFAPAIMAGIVTIFTAGAGSPLLVAAGGLLAGALSKKGLAKQASDLNTLLKQQELNLDNEDIKEIENAKDDLTPGGNTWLYVAGALGLIYLFTRKKRRR